MENPNFRLEGVVKDKDSLQDFEGPLSLILLLLSKNKIEIRDIKISEILDQYMAFLAQMESMDLEITSEFIQMAAHLLYIKTKTLLADDNKEVSELETLMSTLEELKGRDTLSALQKVIPELRTAAEKGSLYFPKPPEPLPKKSKEYQYSHEPVDLLKAMYSLAARGIKVPETDELSSAIPHRIVYSVRDKSRQLLNILRSGERNLSALYAGCATKSEIVATFVAVLELCSMGRVSIEHRGEDINDYSIKLADDNMGDIDDILDKIDNAV